MKKLILCNCLLIKRCFKKFSFILILLAIPVLCILLKDSTKENSSSITAGIYLEEDSPIAQTIANNLITKYDSVRFELCPDLDTLKKRVINGTYESGYVFSKDFDEKLQKSKTKNLVKLYISPDTLTFPLTNEYIFSELFTEYAFQELVSYIKEDEAFKKIDLSDLEDTLRPIYDDYLNGDETFSFEYINPKEGKIDSTQLFRSYLLLSVKGIVALLIMFAAFIGTLNLYKDDKNGVFYAFSGITRTFAKMSEIGSVTLLASISGFISLLACNKLDGILIELLRMVLYVIICTIYCYLLYKLIPNQYIFTSLIPILVLGSIIFCPIFIDMSEIIPFVKRIAWLFLPHYYFLF